MGAGPWCDNISFSPFFDHWRSASAGHWKNANGACRDTFPCLSLNCYKYKMNSSLRCPWLQSDLENPQGTFCTITEVDNV